MFCPRCGVNNVDDAKYCRACGADISLVPQALSRRLPDGASDVLEVEEQGKKGKKRRKNKSKEPPTLEQGLENVFCGIALLVIFLTALFYYGGSLYIWGWLLIPALSCIGYGIGEVIRSNREPRALSHVAAIRPESLPDHPRAKELSAPDTSEIVPARPPSVTEETTRKLGVPASRSREEP